MISSNKIKAVSAALSGKIMAYSSPPSRATELPAGMLPEINRSTCLKTRSPSARPSRVVELLELINVD